MTRTCGRLATTPLSTARRRAGRPRRRAATTLVAGLAAALCAAAPAAAQDTDAWPEAAPADVESVDAIIHALYDVISGGVGEARDWDRFRSLFAPQGRLVPTFTNPQGQRGYLVWTPDEYVQRSGDALSRIGFRETELARTTEQFGNVTHAFSTYASFRSDQGDPDTAFARGINSIQLYHDGTRYWILSVMWDSERPGQPIPERYLGG